MKGLQKKGGYSAFPSKLLFLKKWSQNNTYTLEFLKIAFPFIGSPNLQLQEIRLSYYRIV